MTFLQQAQSRIMLFDGAGGTELLRRGVLAPGECTELLNLTRPADVLDMHMAYIEAGADVITANTFGSNELRLAHFGLAESQEELTQSGVALCREAIAAANRPVFVAASIGPTGELPSSEPHMPQKMYDVFFKQCEAAAAAGADMILIETMVDLYEARLALLAAKASCNLPVLLSFSLEKDGCTPMFSPPEVLSLTATKLGAAMVGVNCGYGPDDLLGGYSRLMASCAIPTFAMPSAGLPENGAYALTPDDFSTALLPYLHAGAAAVGGCCGTTPAHIARLHETLVPFHGHAKQSTQQEEYICSTTTRLPLFALDSYSPVCVSGLLRQSALDICRARAETEEVLHIDFGGAPGEDIRTFLWELIPLIKGTPLAFHVYAARQANAALFAYPGIAAIYAHSDAYRVLKAAVRYGAEVML